MFSLEFWIAESENAKMKKHIKSLSMVQDEIESMKMVKIQLDTKEVELERYKYYFY